MVLKISENSYEKACFKIPFCRLWRYFPDYLWMVLSGKTLQVLQFFFIVCAYLNKTGVYMGSCQSSLWSKFSRQATLLKYFLQKKFSSGLFKMFRKTILEIIYFPGQLCCLRSRKTVLNLYNPLTHRIFLHPYLRKGT